MERKYVGILFIYLAIGFSGAWLVQGFSKFQGIDYSLLVYSWTGEFSLQLTLGNLLLVGLGIPFYPAIFAGIVAGVTSHTQGFRESAKSFLKGMIVAICGFWMGVYLTYPLTALVQAIVP